MPRPILANRPSSLCALIAIALLVTATAAHAKTFAWKATGKGGTVYLVGSIQCMSEELLSA